MFDILQKWQLVMKPDIQCPVSSPCDILVLFIITISALEVLELSIAPCLDISFAIYLSSILILILCLFFPIMNMLHDIIPYQIPVFIYVIASIRLTDIMKHE